ncbi:MAG: N-acetylmuramate alpha-1-phosphate uridylyltransferase MurU [Burkholderiaceae bacterium]
MQAMILAAGRGERMRPLTDTCPKPLLQAGGRSLLEWHLAALATAGFHEVVINHAYLGEAIEAAIGDGRRWGLRIRYAAEPAALETAGGIATAQPWLGDSPDAPFLVVNGDVFSDWDRRQAFAFAEMLSTTGADAQLVLVANPAHHPMGDFWLNATGRIVTDAADSPARRGTFAGIGVYRPSLFAGLAIGQAAPLASLLREAIGRQSVLGCWYDGLWMDIGTPERLNDLNLLLKVSR